MDISRLKKVLAGFSAVAMMLSTVSTAIAAYADVPAGVWYEEAVKSFTDAGYLDASQPNFRATDTANRAEFTKLVVELNGGILSTAPAVPSFDDVKASAWFYGYMEEAGKEGWVKGDGNCYGSHPCYARPTSNVSRAEAAALIVRAFGLESTSDAPTFVDNPSGQWYTDAIQIAADHCVLQGDGATGRVRPTDNMNRAEMVVMLNRVDQGLAYGTDCGGGQTAAPAVSNASAASTVKVLVDFNVAVDKTAAETIANYAVSPALTITSATLTSEKTVELVFSSAMTANKEYALTVSNMKTADGDTFSDTATFMGYSALPQGNGTLEVTVSSSNPIGDTVPKGAHTVPMLSLDLTASCDDSVTVETLTVLHEGFGDKGDIDAVYATIDGGRVSRERTIDSKDQTAEVRFVSPLVVPACKTVTVDVVADIATSATASAEHNFAVELASDLVTNAKSLSGNFPLRGNSFRVGAITSGTLSVAYRTVTPSALEVGDKDVVLGKFEVSTNSIEDQTLYAMTLHQAGTVSDGDVTNIRIRRTDKTVITNSVDQFRSKFAALTFSPPFTVLEGDRITLEVIGDLVGGAAKTVQIDFDETSDIFAVGSLYGYGVNGQLYGSSVGTPTGTVSSITVDAGQFTIAINGPSQQTFTRDQTDAVLANVVFTTGGETVNVKKMYIAVQGNTVTGATLAVGHGNGTSFDDISEVMSSVTLRNATTGRSIEGVQLTGSTEFGTNAGATTATFQIYRFDDFTVNGTENWQLKVDFTDNGTGVSPTQGDQFRALICGEPTQISNATNTVGCSFNGITANATTTTWNLELEGLSTSDKVQDVRPRGTIVGNAQRIADASFTVTVKSLTSTETAVKNAKNIRLLQFEARAGEAKSVLLTKAIFEAVGGATALQNGVNYGLWVDTDGDGTVDTILDSGKSASANTITFDGITNGGFVVGKEQTVKFEVHADIAGSLTTATTLQLRFATGSTSYVEAETVDRGTSLSGIKTNGTCASTCDVTVTTANSPSYSLVSQGTLFVTKKETIRSRQLLAGALGESVLSLNFRAINEPIDITNLQLTSSGSKAKSVDRLDLYKVGQTTPFASATTNNCGSDDVPGFNPGLVNGAAQAQVTTFCASMQSQQLVVPKADEVNVLVKPSMKGDESGATSGTGVSFWIDMNSANSSATGTGAVRARGVDSSNNLAGNDDDQTDDGEVFIGTSTVTSSGTYIAGAQNITVLSKLDSIVNANADANGSNVPSGVKELGVFKFSALTNNNTKNGLNKFTLSGVIFNVTATNVAIDYTSWVFYNKANTSATHACNTFTTAGTPIVMSNSGAFLVQCDNIRTGTVDTKIDPGSNKTFVLRANVTNPDVVATNTSNILVSLQDFASSTNSTFSSTTSHMQWSDYEDQTAVAQDFNWVEYSDTSVNSTNYQS
ncbi:MAG: S-layer homology domain-containing protein [Candidatus Peribacteraceae bacterium]